MSLRSCLKVFQGSGIALTAIAAISMSYNHTLSSGSLDIGQTHLDASSATSRASAAQNLRQPGLTQIGYKSDVTMSEHYW